MVLKVISLVLILAVVCSQVFAAPTQVSTILSKQQQQQQQKQQQQQQKQKQQPQ